MDFELTYWGLFFGCLLSATILPFASEALFLGVIYAGGNVGLTLIIATTGNFLGSVLTYYMGYWGDYHSLEKWFKTKSEKIHQLKFYLDKYGIWAALLSWVPFIGDPLTLTLGFFRVNSLKVLTIILIVKWARYQMLYFMFF